VKFSRKRYQRFSYIFLHLLAILLWAKYEKITKIWQENFEGEESKKYLPPTCYFPLGIWGTQILHVCMPTEFWTPTCSIVQCSLVTTWLCDDLTVWRDDHYDELTGSHFGGGKIQGKKMALPNIMHLWIGLKTGLAWPGLGEFAITDNSVFNGIKCAICNFCT